MIELTLGTNVKIARTYPIFVMTAFLTDKPIWPFLLEQIRVAGFWVQKAMIELNFVFRKIVVDCKVSNNSLLFW